jgi:hypothetical protein
MPEKQVTEFDLVRTFAELPDARNDGRYAADRTTPRSAVPGVYRCR